MTQAKAALLYCDAEDGLCGGWELDYYGQTVSAVNGIRVTTTERAPGWLTTRDGDYCPEHADKPTTPTPAASEGQAAGGQ